MELDGQSGTPPVIEETSAEAENVAETAAENNAEAAAGAAYGTSAADAVTGTEAAGKERADTVQDVIYVHICGAVAAPGVYELSVGSRVYEGIEAAGGFREDACEDYINQAMPLQDGQRLMIPTEEEVEAAREEGSLPDMWGNAGGADASGTAGAAGAADTAGVVSGSSRSDGLVNINTASESELCGIDGIGAGKAAAIVRYRQENGNFASIEEIMQVSGIKEGTYEKIKDRITVN